MPKIQHFESLPAGSAPAVDTVPTDQTPVVLPVLNPEVEFELPDGRHVKMGKPLIPSALLMPTLLASSEPNVMSAFATEQLVKAMLYVKELNGAPVNQITEFKDVQNLGRQLGETGIDAVMLMFNKFFPPLTEKQLKIIKK